MPACGELTREALELPDAERTRELFAGVKGAPASIENVRRERGALPHLLDDAHGEIEGAFDRLVAEALAPLGLEDRHAAVRVLTDLAVWRALADRGLTGREAADVATAAVLGALDPAK